MALPIRPRSKLLFVRLYHLNGQGLIDVTDTANVKCKFGVYSTAPVTFWGQSGRNATYFTFLKLADT